MHARHGCRAGSSKRFHIFNTFLRRLARVPAPRLDQGNPTEEIAAVVVSHYLPACASLRAKFPRLVVVRDPSGSGLEQRWPHRR